MVNVFAVPVLFICFRECLETTIVVAILLSFLKQSLLVQSDSPKVYKQLRLQVWSGVALGLLVVVIVGCGMIGAFYGLSKNVFSKTEDIWEGAFALVATIIITIMGAALLRINKMRDGWREKITKLLDKNEDNSKPKHPLGRRFAEWAERYALFLLPFFTVLREGLEAVVFIGGVGLGLPASAFPLPVLCGFLAGFLIGFIIYKGGNHSSLQFFLILSTCFLYLVAAGLFSRAVWLFETDHWNKIVGGDASEVGSDAGSYNIETSVWHVNCCNPQISGGGGWGIFNSLFGWTNSATYGSVISYNLYWIVIILGFFTLRYKETKGHFPLMVKSKNKGQSSDQESQIGSASSDKEPSPNGRNLDVEKHQQVVAKEVK